MKREYTTPDISGACSVIKRGKCLWTNICLIVLLVIALTACGGTATGVSNVVHLGATNFKQQAITIKKGERVTLVNDSAVTHIIENGTWEQGSNGSVYQAKSYREPGAPKVDVQVAGNTSQTIGPFQTVGVFHLYCVVHPGMNLTVIVR
jgi:plastocyanin